MDFAVAAGVELTVCLIVALAQSAYESAKNIRRLDARVANLAERVAWIVKNSEKWKVQTDGNVLIRLQEVLEDINLCFEAASKEASNWSPKIIKFVGRNHLSTKLQQAETKLNGVLHDLQVDQNWHITDQINRGFAAMKQLLQSYGSTASFSNPNKTNQQEMAEALSKHSMETSRTTSDPQSGGDNKVGDTTLHPSSKDINRLELNLKRLKWKETSILGDGAFSKVYAGTYGKLKVAIKRIQIEATSKAQLEQDLKKIKEEAWLGNRCSIHSYIVQIFGFVIPVPSRHERQGRLSPMIVMEYMHTTLSHVIHDRKKESELPHYVRLRLLLCVARALEFLHLQGIVHHDVKPSNVLLNSSLTEAKLADFGEAKVNGLNTTSQKLSTILSTSDRRGGSVAGTVAYQAPEIIARTVTGSSRIAEMYSFGVTIWECLTERIPHEGKREADIAIHVTSKEHLPMLPDPSHPHDLKKDGWESLAWKNMQSVASPCLSRSREERLTASQVVAQWSSLEFVDIDIPPLAPSWQEDVEMQEPTSLGCGCERKKKRRTLLIVLGIAVLLVVAATISYFVVVRPLSGGGGAVLTADQTKESPQAPVEEGTTSPTTASTNSSTVATLPTSGDQDPTESPVEDPTRSPSPVSQPVRSTPSPTTKPTLFPTYGPVRVTNTPFQSPTEAPIDAPTKTPTETPTPNPTWSPTNGPVRVTNTPFQSPTEAPIDAPTKTPTETPTPNPTWSPTNAPVRVTNSPERTPTEAPTVGGDEPFLDFIVATVGSASGDMRGAVALSGDGKTFGYGCRGVHWFYGAECGIFVEREDGTWPGWYRRHGRIGGHVCMNQPGTTMYTISSGSSRKLYRLTFSGTSPPVVDWEDHDHDLLRAFRSIGYGGGLACAAGSTIAVTVYNSTDDTGGFKVFSANSLSLTDRGGDLSFSFPLGRDGDVFRTGSALAIDHDATTVVFSLPGNLLSYKSTGNARWEAFGELRGQSGRASSVSLNGAGNRLAIGYYDELELKGRVVLFDREGDGWIQFQVLEGTEYGETYGYALHLSADGTSLIVGAPGATQNTGRIFLYDYIEATSSFQLIIRKEGNQRGAYFGAFVATSGEMVAVGVPDYHAENVTSAGAAVLYKVIRQGIRSNL